MPDKLHAAAVRAADCLPLDSGDYHEALERITREYRPLVEAARRILEYGDVFAYKGGVSPHEQLREALKGVVG